MLTKLTHFISIIFISILFISCQEATVEPVMNNDGNVELNLNKDLRIPDTYVTGIVYKQGSPVFGATVQLIKNSIVLASTTTNKSGYYSICVCCEEGGTGTYYVKATHGTDIATDSFYWNVETGPWGFTIDLHLNVSK